jgi:serine protease Do
MRTALAMGSARCRGFLPLLQHSERHDPRSDGGERLTIRQGSGFFIWADGYAVTNAHMVDTAEGAEIMTQDGKIYIARVSHRSEDRPRPHQGRPACRFFVKLADGLSRVGDQP